MLNIPITSVPLLFILFLVFCASIGLQLFFYWVFFFRLSVCRERPQESGKKGVSVVICARNEYTNLKENLPLFLEQDYPDFEVVVVNHASDDDSAFLLSQMAEKDPRLKIVDIIENLNFFSGKKFPLSIGIKSARNEIVLLTDADCRPAGKDWILKMQEAFTGQKEIVLGYGGYRPDKGFLNKLIRFDTVHIAMQYLSSALNGIPYMGVGRNMAYTKNLFYRNNGFIYHYKIHSGDDDLFINRVATKKNTRIVLDPATFTYSNPKKNFRDWVYQKRRHLSTGRFYRFRHQLLLGSYLVSQFLYYLLFILLILLNFNISLILALFIFKTGNQLFVFRRCMVRFSERGFLLAVPFLELFLLVSNAYFSVKNLLAPNNRWK
jgi:glycosyltransferase involved in cell wall biosynthesis